MNLPGGRIEGTPALTVRRMSPADGPFVHAILKESPEASIWSLESLRESSSHGLAWIAELEGQVAGVLLGQLAADEFEILNLAVGKAHRRKGIATQLLNSALEHARFAGVRRIFLEVRASNAGAIAFYSRFGFGQGGRRASYYRDPAEDALLLVLHVNEKNS